MKLFDRQALFELLDAEDQASWAKQLDTICRERFNSQYHGTLPQWIEAYHQLPCLPNVHLNADGDVIKVTGPLEADARENLTNTLMQFHPWRKGPFNLFGVHIETEWRSDWKWQRIASAVDFAGKKILDIGAGNGYYGWRMLAAGAQWVLGIDPFLLYLMQFEVFNRYANSTQQQWLLPITDSEIPAYLGMFDLVLSMGVLYHRHSPIDHLRKIHGSLQSRGQLLLETLVIEDTQTQVLVPEGRYAKMRNVWFIPTVKLLETWLRRTGFTNVRVIDVTRTTTAEQRRTAWMTFESLSDFLDPENPHLTIEGYPSPVRATLVAERSN